MGSTKRNRLIVSVACIQLAACSGAEFSGARASASDGAADARGHDGSGFSGVDAGANGQSPGSLDARAARSDEAPPADAAAEGHPADAPRGEQLDALAPIDSSIMDSASAGSSDANFSNVDSASAITPETGSADVDPIHRDSGRAALDAAPAEAGPADGPVDVVPDVTCSPVPTWFPDVDGDGFGRTSGAVAACVQPGAAWSDMGGDCNDDLGDVHPMQRDFFSKPYISAAGDPSFDYDCSGEEQGDPSQLGSAPECGLLGLVNCAGSGFMATGRSGSGVNALCGSNALRTCQAGLLLCEAQSSTTSTVKRCR